MSPQTPPLVRSAWAVPGAPAVVAPFQRLLAASDATEAAEGALRVVHALAARDDAVMTVVSVVEPAPYPSPASPVLLTLGDAPLAHIATATLAARHDAVLAQSARCGTAPVRAIRVVETPMPAHGILQVAAESDAEAVVLGLGRHGPLDRLFGSETALQVVRAAMRATLAVPARQRTVPAHAVVGMDFSDSALAATRLAARLVGARGRLTLVHIEPVGEPVPSMLSEWHGVYAEGVQAAFSRTVASMGLPRSLTVETLTLAGHAANALLGLVDRSGADLLSLGRHSYGAVERLILGSVTTRVLRSASCAVAVAAPTDG